jgi:hypothetical protein
MWQGVKYLVSWYWTVVKWEARETWRALPGPWWVKTLIIVGCLAIPGQLDEIAVIALCKLFRARKARREALS